MIDKAERRRRDGIRHRLAVPDSDVSVHVGLRVSSPTQLFVEMGRWLNLVDLVVLGDAMVKRGLVPLAALRAACDSSQLRGVSAAARAAAYVREGVDSPMESRLRMLLVLAGLPEPEIDVRFLRRDGSVMLRLDLAYRDHKVGLEYDGRQHRDDLDQWDRDLDRGDWFEQAGWTVIKVVARGVYRRPDQTIERVRRTLAARRRPAATALRRVAGLLARQAVRSPPPHNRSQGPDPSRGTGVRPHQPDPGAAARGRQQQAPASAA